MTNSFDRDIDAALATNEPIPRERVFFWIKTATEDLSTLAKLYRLTGEGYHRIQPNLDQDTTCNLIQRYLLECIRQDVQQHDGVQDRWEAAGTLHAWFCHLAGMKDTSAVLTRASHAITELFLTGTAQIRAAIEQGFLEHVLETAALRPYFQYWASDERLKAACARALKWGKAHPDHTWGLLQELRRKIESKS